MKTMAGCALVLALTGGCAPGGELSPTPTPVRAQAAAYVAAPTAVATPTTCGPAKVSSLRELLPDAEIIGAFELDVEHLRRGKLFPEVERELAVHGADVLAAMDTCGVPLAKVEGLVAGFSDTDDMMVGVRAKGLGEPATLDCLAGKIEKATGKAPWKRVTSACETTLELPDGDAKGFVVGHDMVVLASKSLETAMGRRVAGKDRSALEGRLAWARKEVDMGNTAWVATNVPASAGAGLPASMAGLSRVGMSIDATKGLGLRLGAGFSSASEAKAATKELESQLVQLKMMLPMLGLPSSVGDTIEVGTKGSVLRMGMFLQLSDIEALRAVVTGTSGGSSKPAPPPGTPRPGM
jgi:hypothetical protein